MNHLSTIQEIEQALSCANEAIQKFNEGHRLRFLILHCTATPPTLDVTKTHIEQWHRGPSNLLNGKVRYLGKIYDSRKDLPNDKIGGVLVKDLKGRGWKSLGYSLLVKLDGTIDIVTPFSNTGIVHPEEVTNGVRGQNSWSRHFVYAGGVNEKMEEEDTRTEAQITTLENLVKLQVMHHPDIQVGGHNQFNAKACPSYDVPAWLRSIGIATKNIYKGES